MAENKNSGYWPLGKKLAPLGAECVAQVAEDYLLFSASLRDSLCALAPLRETFSVLTGTSPVSFFWRGVYGYPVAAEAPSATLLT